ncbi:MarR family winged helix-turn-helix transcriptional regulator [Pendulispora albinea]|uniref:MarR family transcriptional regulator n=1 Tax=Pendulispora albinea TaxID=2741071 RepID=A0ABZ2LS09_9BACT
MSTAAVSAPKLPPSHGLRTSKARLRSARDVSLWVRLLDCHNRMLVEIRRRLDGQITLPRFDLLANLEREDGQTLASLSRRLLVTAGNLTGLVDRAERDGVVVRRADPSDRRLSRVFLTRKGRELVSELVPMHAEHVGELLSALDPSERREMRRLLGKLRQSLATSSRAAERAESREPKNGSKD